MSESKYIIKFEGGDLAQANSYAAELRDALLEAAADKQADIDVSVSKGDATTMDFGATLIIILGTPAVVAVAKGVADWLKKRNTASITIETSDGKLVAKNISARDAAILAEKFKP